MAESWSDYFEFSMHSIDMPVPSGLFADAVSAVGTISSIQRAVALAGGTGGDVTIGELAGAGTIPEALTVVGGVLASAYAGALVGASIYATACVAGDFFSVSGASDVDTSDTDVDYWHGQGAAVAAAAGSSGSSASPASSTTGAGSPTPATQ